MKIVNPKSPQARSAQASREMLRKAGYITVTLYIHPNFQLMFDQLLNTLDVPKSLGKAKAELLSENLLIAMNAKSAAFEVAVKALNKRPKHRKGKSEDQSLAFAFAEQGNTEEEKS